MLTYFRVLLVLVAIGYGACFELYAQTIEGGEIRGNFAIDAQYYRQDSTIGAAFVEERMRFMAAGNLIYTKGKFTAGVRFESYEKALLGIDQGFNDGGAEVVFPIDLQPMLTMTWKSQLETSMSSLGMVLLYVFLRIEI